MKNKSSSASGGGMGLLGVLQVIFIVLKCIGVIAWSWWAVLIPLWISMGLAVLAVFLYFILSLVD